MCDLQLNTDPFFVSDIAAAIKELQSGRHGQAETDENKAERIGLGAEGHFDTDIYSSSKLSGLSGQYVDSIAPNDDQDVCVAKDCLLFGTTCGVRSETYKFRL